jgi:hypothetical protein
MLRFHVLVAALVTLYICPCFAGPIYRSDSGTGSAVIVPFWTVNAQQDSYLHINNDGPRPSAVRVRILDQKGELLSSLGVYLDRDDQWTAAFTIENGQAELVTPDASCVILEDGSSTFGSSTAAIEIATLPATAGSIEIIEMATAALDTLASMSGMWPDCGALAERFSSGIWSDNPNSALMPPAEGISASISILRVGAGTMNTMQGTALAGFSDIAQHAPPGNHEPDLSNASDTGSGNGTVRSQVCFEAGCRIDPWDSPLEAIAAVLSTISLRMDFAADASIAAKFDLVIHRPLERYETESGLLIEGPVSLYLTDRNGVPMLPEEGGLRISEDLVMQVLGFESSPLLVDPPTPQPTPVLAFPTAPEFYLGALQTDDFLAGTAEIRFETPIDPGTGLVAPDGFRFAGEPVIAFGIQQYTNGFIDVGAPQTVLSNYRGTVMPRAERRLDPPMF